MSKIYYGVGESQNAEKLDNNPTKGWIIIRPRVGDIVRLRKAHPYGSYEWEVVRMGADIGLKCLKCQRRVLLARSIFERRVKNMVAKKD